ncbi:MAG: carbohydrate ABC transporter permease [Angelakisella sp.]|nr:carbohydrate ABC transporter permease [Angelakisella sp.]
MSFSQSVSHRVENKGVLWLRRFIAYAVVIFMSFLSLFFIYILFVNATRSHFQIQSGFSFLPGNYTMQNYNNVISDPNVPVLSGLANSTIVASGCAVLSVYFSALTAYGIHTYQFKGNTPALQFILMIMMVPTQVSALGFINMVFKMNLKNSFLPLILPSIAAPMVFFFMLQYMKGNLSVEIIEAARIDGSGEFATFNRIALPILKPAMAVQAIFTFVTNWNNYFIPALVLEDTSKKTLPVLIAILRSADWLKFDMGKVYMMVALSILPVVVVYLCLSKYIVGGVALGSVKG